MKRLACFALTLLLMLSQACAEGSATKKKNVFEFCDMYMHRLREAKHELWIDATHDLSSYMGYDGLLPMNVFAGSNQYFVEVPAGTLLVSVPDFSVIWLKIPFVSFYRSESEREIELIRAAVAFAALEYDRFDDYAYPILHKIDPTKPESVLLEVMDVFFGAVDNTFNNAVLMDGFFSKSGNSIPFFSGNYEYSLQYTHAGEDNPDIEFVDLIVECK